MVNYINALVESSKNIINQMTGENLTLKNIRTKEEVRSQETLTVISGICNKDKSFQIMLNYTEILAKNISSIVKGGIPIAILDEESKYIIIEISKMIISNSIIQCENKIEDIYVIQPSLIKANNLSYNTEGLITTLEFELLEEDMKILIMPIKNIEDLEYIKNIEEKYI